MNKLIFKQKTLIHNKINISFRYINNIINQIIKNSINLKANYIDHIYLCIINIWYSNNIQGIDMQYEYTFVNIDIKVPKYKNIFDNEISFSDKFLFSWKVPNL